MDPPLTNMEAHMVPPQRTVVFVEPFLRFCVSSLKCRPEPDYLALHGPRIGFRIVAAATPVLNKKNHYADKTEP